MNKPLRSALDDVQACFGDDSSLLPLMAADAVMSRVALDGLTPCLPRLLELMVTNELDDVEPWRISDLLTEQAWSAWPANEREPVEAVFDRWWATTLAIHPFPPGADTILGTLMHLDVPLVRWLNPFLNALDGPAASHLTDLALDGLNSPAWDHYQNQSDIVKAWMRTDSVVMGMTIVGGQHLQPGQLSDLLDYLL